MDAPAETALSSFKPGDDVQLLVRLLKLGSFVNTPMKEGVCDAAGISATELKVMMALAGEGALAGHDLVAIMGVPPMNVSRALAGLRARGWIEDASDPENRRRKPVHLSVAGLEAYEGMTPSIAEIAEALLGKLTTRQRQAFAAAADVIVASMVDWIDSHHEGLDIRH